MKSSIYIITLGLYFVISGAFASPQTIETSLGKISITKKGLKDDSIWVVKVNGKAIKEIENDYAYFESFSDNPDSKPILIDTGNDVTAIVNSNCNGNACIVGNYSIVFIPKKGAVRIIDVPNNGDVIEKVNVIGHKIEFIIERHKVPLIYERGAFHNFSNADPEPLVDSSTPVINADSETTYELQGTVVKKSQYIDTEYTFKLDKPVKVSDGSQVIVLDEIDGFMHSQGDINPISKENSGKRFVFRVTMDIHGISGNSYDVRIWLQGTKKIENAKELNTKINNTAQTTTSTSVNSSNKYVKNILEGSLKDDEKMIVDNKLILEGLPRPNKGDRKSARLANDEGLVFIKKNQYENAVPLLEKASQLDPSDVEVMNNYGYALLKSNQLDRAESVLVNVLIIKPDRVSAWANYADTMALGGKEDLAVAAYLNAFRFTKDREKTVQFFNKQLEDEKNSNVRSALTKALAKAEKLP